MTAEVPEYGGDLQYTKSGRCLGDVLTSKKPVISFSGTAKRYKSTVHVDTDMITQELVRSGFNPEIANSSRIIFHHDNGKDETGLNVGGWHKPDGSLRTKKKMITYHVLTTNVVLPQSEKSANKTLWHELGHGHAKFVSKVQKDVLYTPRNTKRLERVGYGIAASGLIFDAITAIMDTMHGQVTSPREMLVGAAGVAVGALLKSEAKYALWFVDGSERYARKFARKRRHLKPITFRV